MFFPFFSKKIRILLIFGRENKGAAMINAIAAPLPIFMR